MGEIAYTLGRLYRQEQRFENARREFNHAIRLYEQRAHRVPHSGAPGDDRQFSIHKLATIAALGLSMCNYTTGNLTTALYGNLASARLLLESTGDILNRKYADVIHASAVRALEGKDRADLKALSEAVQDAVDVFRGYGHSFYEAGALLELAYIALAQGDFCGALKHCDAAKELTVKCDFRWKFGREIVRSRAFRRLDRLSDAKDAANAAFKLAKRRKDRVAKIGALMVRSNAYPRSDIRLAIEDLSSAMQLNKAEDGRFRFMNPRIHAECCLRRAGLYFEFGALQDAAASFAEWEGLSSSVENARLHEMAREIENNIRNGRRFLIDIDKDGQDYKHLDLQLRRFLLIQAAKESKALSRIALALKTDRGTISRWLNEFRRDPEVRALGISSRRPSRKPKSPAP